MPRSKRVACEARKQVDLALTAGLRPATRCRRDRLHDELVGWTSCTLDADFAAISQSGLLLGMALQAFGRFLFYTGRSKYDFAEAINSTADRFGHFRPFFSAAWKLLTRWEEVEPVQRGMVFPEVVLRAAVSVSLLWSWPRFAAAILIGFHALLRPGEILPLQRCHLILPCDMISDEAVAYVCILNSKTRRFLQRQHAKVSDAATVRFLQGLFRDLPSGTPLFAASAAQFRSRWNDVFSNLGLPVAERDNGVAPKALRGSGATWLFHMTEDLQKVMWRGRWRQQATLEHYIQDVTGQMFFARLKESSRHRIRNLAGHAASLMAPFAAAPPLGQP